MNTRYYNALFLAEDESALTLDRKVLRSLGVTPTQFFSSGREALLHLKDAALTAKGDICPASFDMIICCERLADMTGLHFLARIRSLATGYDIPVVLLAGNAESRFAVAARSTRSCVVLTRPYSQEQAEEALAIATLPEWRHAPMVLPPDVASGVKVERVPQKDKTPLLRRDTRSAVPNTPGERALREGVKALQRGEVQTAASLLHGSYSTDPGRIETCLALSRLYTLLKQPKQEQEWLCRAGVLCLKRGEIARAKGLFSRLPHSREGQAPLLAEAGLVLQAGEITAAALSFLEAYRLEPSQPLHTLIGRTCMFTPAPEEHMRELVKALAANGHSEMAAKLQWRLLTPPKETEEENDSFLAQFPMLYDIFCVAAYTFKTWRHAA